MRYIAEVLKTRSNLAAKSKVQLLPLAAVVLKASFKFLGKGGAGEGGGRGGEGGGLCHGWSYASLTSMR